MKKIHHYAIYSFFTGFALMSLVLISPVFSENNQKPVSDIQGTAQASLSVDNTKSNPLAVQSASVVKSERKRVYSLKATNRKALKRGSVLRSDEHHTLSADEREANIRAARAHILQNMRQASIKEKSAN